MKFDTVLQLKWIPLGQSQLAGKSYTLIEQGLLISRNSSGSICGFTVFNPDKLSVEFFERLEQRRHKPEFAGCQFELYLPSKIKNTMKRFENQCAHVPLHFRNFLKLTIEDHKISLKEKMTVVNVDDSPVMLKFLKHTLEEIDYIEVVEQISDPKKAARKIESISPDLVTMDIQMPHKTGVEVVTELMAIKKIPVIMISSLGLEEGSLVFQALNAGAFDYLQKPRFEDKESFKEELEIKCMAAFQGDLKKSLPLKVSLSKPLTQISKNLIWCLGASTGGTQALTHVFTAMAGDIPPTLIVQHIPPVFSKAFADSLAQLCPYKVTEAKNGDVLEPNHIYIAQGGTQMGLEMKEGRLTIAVRDDQPVNRFKPSVDYLFLDVAKCKGLEVVAGVLTGMGKDGAQGLLELKKRGAQTFAQDEESSAVYGMPRAAFEVGATQTVVGLDLIPQTLVQKSQLSKAS